MKSNKISKNNYTYSVRSFIVNKSEIFRLNDIVIYRSFYRESSEVIRYKCICRHATTTR